MPSLIAHLDKRAQRALLDDLNYLNLGEVSAFCREHGIPTAIYVETDSGKRRRTRDTDRKSVVLDRVRSYLKTGRVPEATVFRAAAARLEGLPANPRPTDRLYYGCYDKKNPKMLALLQGLTDGAFRNGAVAASSRESTGQRAWRRPSLSSRRRGWRQTRRAWASPMESTPRPPS